VRCQEATPLRVLTAVTAVLVPQAGQAVPVARHASLLKHWCVKGVQLTAAASRWLSLAHVAPQTSAVVPGWCAAHHL
jgi:hypothetical protein